MKKHQTFISYLSICLLILNIGLANATSVNNDKILLCTSQGYVWVTLPKINSDLSAIDLSGINKSDVNIHTCPFCTSSNIDNDDIIQSFYGPKPHQYIDTSPLDHSSREPLRHTQHYSSLQSRAPPLYS